MAKKLLIADGSLTIQRIVSLTFANEDVEVLTASDGETAIEVINESHPDIVLLDTGLPKKNGYQICEYIKSSPQLRSTPTLLLVGTFESLDESEAERVKADGSLSKPFESSLLVSQVNQFLSRAHAPAEAVYQAQAASNESLLEINLGTPLNESTRVSFVDDPILEIYSHEALRILRGDMDAQAPAPPAVAEEPDILATEPRPVEPLPEEQVAKEPVAEPPIAQPPVAKEVPSEPVSEEMVDLITRRVIERMSESVIREIAWEVVPELAERIVKEELGKRNRK